ncbi:MAG: hypothetical protein WCQ90_08225 [Deltaproteobacteria bacterium]
MEEKVEETIFSGMKTIGAVEAVCLRFDGPDRVEAWVLVDHDDLDTAFQVYDQESRIASILPTVRIHFNLGTTTCYPLSSFPAHWRIKPV